MICRPRCAIAHRGLRKPTAVNRHQCRQSIVDHDFQPDQKDQVKRANIGDITSIDHCRRSAQQESGPTGAEAVKRAAEGAREGGCESRAKPLSRGPREAGTLDGRNDPSHSLSSICGRKKVRAPGACASRPAPVSCSALPGRWQGRRTPLGAAEPRRTERAPVPSDEGVGISSDEGVGISTRKATQGCSTANSAPHSPRSALPSPHRVTGRTFYQWQLFVAIDRNFRLRSRTVEVLMGTIIGGGTSCCS